MKRTLISLALLTAFAASAQDLSAQSGAASQSAAGAQSGSVAAGNVVVFNPSSAGATATGAGGIPTTRIINERSGTDRTEQVLSGTTTQNLNSTSRAEQILSGSTTSNDNVRYSGTVENRTSGGTYNVLNENVHYSGTQTIKNVPGIALSGPASAPCGGVSGSIGLAGPGFGVGGNFAKEDVACTARENSRVLGMAVQSIDSGAYPQERGEVMVMFMDSLRNIKMLNERIAADVKAK